MGRYSGFGNYGGYYGSYFNDDDYYDDYYDYKKPKKQIKHKEYDYNSWSWSSYGLGFTTDDDSSLFTVEPLSYLTPKESEIRKSLTQKGITQKDVNLIKNLTRFFYFRMIEEPKYLKEIEEIEDMDETKVDEYKFLKSILSSLEPKEVPGYTPLEQALLTYNELIKDNSSGMNGVSSREMEQNAERMHFDRELYYDAELNAMIDKLDFTKKFKSTVLKKMSMIKNFGSKFKVEKEVEEKEVSNSSIITVKKMTSYEQITHIDLYQRLLPGFNLKFAMKDLTVNIPVDRTEHKQKIIIMLDGSGSMCDETKQLWVCSILMDRMKYVIKGEAEIYFSYFVTSFEKFVHIKNKEDVLDFWKKVYCQRPNGGTTKVGELIQQVERDVSNKKLHNLDIDLSEERPEVLIINDGY